MATQLLFVVFKMVHHPSSCLCVRRKQGLSAQQKPTDENAARPRQLAAHGRTSRRRGSTDVLYIQPSKKHETRRRRRRERGEPKAAFLPREAGGCQIKEESERQIDATTSPRTNQSCAESIATGVFSHLFPVADAVAGSSFTARRAGSLMRAPPSIRTAAHASCPSRIASSRGSTLL